MKTLNLLVLISILGVSLSNAASPDPRNSSLLWKVTGEGMQTSYIYGTMHVINKSDFLLGGAVTEALSSCEAIVFEMDMDEADLQQQLMMHAQMSGGQTLNTLISPENYAIIDSVMQSTYGMGLAMLNTMKPFLVSSMLLPTIMDEETASYEATFMAMAAEKNMEILGLETPAEQMALFDSISYESQAEDLVEFVTEPAKMREILNAMVVQYHEGDIDALYDLFLEYYEGNREIEILLDFRNKRWVEDMPDLAADQAVFFAVGAGHLGGKNGVINLLRDKGYEVTPLAME